MQTHTYPISERLPNVKIKLTFGSSLLNLLFEHSLNIQVTFVLLYFTDTVANRRELTASSRRLWYSSAVRYFPGVISLSVTLDTYRPTLVICVDVGFAVCWCLFFWNTVWGKNACQIVTKYRDCIDHHYNKYKISCL